MKNLFAISILLVFVGLMAACAGSVSAQNTSPEFQTNSFRVVVEGLGDGGRCSVGVQVSRTERLPAHVVAQKAPLGPQKLVVKIPNGSIYFDDQIDSAAPGCALYAVGADVKVPPGWVYVMRVSVSDFSGRPEFYVHFNLVGLVKLEDVRDYGPSTVLLEKLKTPK